MTEGRPTPTTDDPEAPFGRTESGEPIAPFGFTTEGRPKRSPGGRPPGSGTTRPKAAPPPPKRKAPPPRKKAPGPDYASAVMDVARGPMIGLTIAGMKVPALLADAVTLEQHLPPIAEELGKLAEARPEVAAMLDRLLVAGPYTALLGAVVPLGLQLLANHGVIAGGFLGTVAPEQLIGAMEPPTPEQLAAFQAAAEAEAMAAMNGSVPGAS